MQFIVKTSLIFFQAGPVKKLQMQSYVFWQVSANLAVSITDDKVWNPASDKLSSQSAFQD